MWIVLQPQKVNFLVWADSVSLAATWEIAFAFSSSRYLDVSVPWVCLNYPMYSDRCTVPLRTVGFPIRKSSDRSLLTTPRGISVLVPSFFGSQCQGIHRAPLFTRSEEHTSELQSRGHLVCRLLLAKQ